LSKNSPWQVRYLEGSVPTRDQAFYRHSVACQPADQNNSDLASWPDGAASLSDVSLRDVSLGDKVALRHPRPAPTKSAPTKSARRLNHRPNSRPVVAADCNGSIQPARAARLSGSYRLNRQSPSQVANSRLHAAISPLKYGASAAAFAACHRLAVFYCSLPRLG